MLLEFRERAEKLDIAISPAECTDPKRALAQKAAVVQPVKKFLTSY